MRLEVDRSQLTYLRRRQLDLQLELAKVKAITATQQETIDAIEDQLLVLGDMIHYCQADIGDLLKKHGQPVTKGETIQSMVTYLTDLHSRELDLELETAKVEAGAAPQPETRNAIADQRIVLLENIDHTNAEIEGLRQKSGQTQTSLTQPTAQTTPGKQKAADSYLKALLEAYYSQFVDLDRRQVDLKLELAKVKAGTAPQPETIKAIEAQLKVAQYASDKLEAEIQKLRGTPDQIDSTDERVQALTTIMADLLRRRVDLELEQTKVEAGAAPQPETIKSIEAQMIELTYMIDRTEAWIDELQKKRGQAPLHPHEATGGTAYLIVRATRTRTPLPPMPATSTSQPATQATLGPTTQPTTSSQPASEPAEGNLKIGKEHPGGLRIESYPADDAKPGLCAIGLYDHAKTPSLHDLYDWAVKRHVAKGSNELIGRLPGDSTPIKIMQFSRKGSEFQILVALSPKKSEGSNYIWSELPRNLPAGRYHVVLTGSEYEERDGQLVPAPATTLRAFYQLECYFVVGGTPEQDAAWEAQSEAVDKTFRQLADRLKFLQTDFPKNQPNDKPELFLDMRRTAAGDVTIGSIQFQYNWSMSVPREPPAPGTSGLAVFVNAFRRDYPWRANEFTLVTGPVVWDGKSERRLYAFDTKEFGWRVSVTVEGNQPEIVKKVNGVIDEELTKLSAVLSKPALTTQPVTSPATQR